jgi:hypothetical protein
MAESMEGFFQWLEELLKKLFPGKSIDPEEKTSGGVLDSAFLYLLLFAGAAGAALVLQKMFRAKPKDEEARVPEPSTTSADLEDESILASDLPENEWITIAHDLLERGEVRLGLRAMYLAALAHLADRGIISLARHKTDREYERELASRGESLKEITSAFKDLTGVFEKAWYGMHATSSEALEFFIKRHQEVMTDGA